jgi:uncharacterized protein (TIGR03086 family)
LAPRNTDAKWPTDSPPGTRSPAQPRRPDTGPADRPARSSHARTARQLQQVDGARPGTDRLGDDPERAYRDSAVALQTAFAQPGVLERTYHGPLGAATGAERLQIRLYDLLAHGWDLAQATGQPAELPDDLAEQSLAFVRTQLREQARPGRFGPAQTVTDDAPAIERLVAFLGRPVSTDR